MKSKRIALTAGEPAGIGPDVLLQSLQKDYSAQLVYIGDPIALEKRAKLLGLPTKLVPIDLSQEIIPHRASVIPYVPVEGFVSVEPGQLQVKNSAYILKVLERAIQLCQQNQCDALVTGPIHKGIINEAGFSFSGHTEFLQKLTQTPQVVMMLAHDMLRVALTTTHIPLRKVADQLTPALLHATLEILYKALHRQFGIDSPKIYVCGLNPHAGEGGHLGFEEQTIIEPCLDKLREQGWDLIGPVPADTAFLSQNIERADAFLTHYHDQGLPVLKHMGFESAVNITLGLPILRTSVDHGTALELAGTGQASNLSFDRAIEYAINMSVACI